MAWIFSLWGVTSTEAEAAVFISFFENRSVETPVGKFPLSANHQLFQNQFHTVWIIPGNISNRGIQSVKDAEEMSYIALELYKILREVPPVYKYVLVGVEADHAREPEELKNNPDDILLFKGIVISKKFYREIGSSVKLEEFNEDYFWIPYEGEQYGKWRFRN